MRKFLLLLLIIHSLLPKVVHGQLLLVQKLTLEKSIQERTEKIVEKIIGSGEMVVLVDVELTQEKTKPGEKPTYPGMSITEEEYLPGITYTYMPVEGVTSGNTVIEKISISVTVDQKISPSPILIDRIKKEVNSLLGLNPLRGDIVSVQKIVFAGKKVSWREQVFNLVPQIHWLIGLLLLFFFLFGPLRHFFRIIVKGMELHIEADTKIRGYDEAMRGGGNPNPFMPGPSGPIELSLSRKRLELESSKAGGAGMKKFGFINEGNIKNLIPLLKDEKPETIAVISNYIPPDIASILINSLSPQQQLHVAMYLSISKVVDPEKVNEIEKEVKIKIEYLVGGEENFLNLLDQVDRETQENIFKSLEETNPALAAKLENQLFFFEDIVILDRPVLQKIIREIQRQGISLALALKWVQEEIKSKIMDALTEGARAMLAEQIDLLGEITEKRVKEEHRLITSIIKNLEKSGDIVIDRTKKHKIIEQENETSVIPEEIPEK